MKTVQLYNLKPTDEMRLHARPAQFVHPGNESEEIIGFIVACTAWELTICLFEPRPLTTEMSDMRVIAENGVNWSRLLVQAIVENPEMKYEWANVFGIHSPEIDELLKKELQESLASID